MWTVNALDVKHLGRTPGGERFTDLVDRLIRAQGFAGGVPFSAIATNMRNNRADGGVDTRVDMPIPGDPTGYVAIRTIWQYKATEAAGTTEADLQKEINKPYARECIGKGYAYRFCICDEVTPEKKDEWVAKLTEFARAIEPSAPAAMVVAAGDLAPWARMFPALLVSLFPMVGRGTVLHLGAWGKNARDVTPIFVPVPSWEPARESIAAHVAMGQRPSEVVLPVKGEAGVGKTRLAYEVLAGIDGSGALVLYTDDERLATEVAAQLANDDTLTTILVADECSLQTRLRLRGLLQGHRHRVRVISIDNAADLAPSGAPEYRIERIPDDKLQAILLANFPIVPPERQRAYTDLSGGFVRLAADLCHNDATIATVGHVGPALGSVDDYLSNRLKAGEFAVVEALALVTKVGHKHDVAHELDQLCALVGLDRDVVRPIIDRLRLAPGFVVKAGRYLYITPEIIAQVAFDRAWRRWGADDPPRFLAQMPDLLLEPFQRRVIRSAAEEVRRAVGDYFRQWAWSLDPGHLAQIAAVRPLVILTEADPDTYLPLLRALVERASREELLRVSGDLDGERAPRRHIVWLVERLLAFPDYFDAAEAILLRLALAENEPGIGNNATTIWRQLFRIALSGTSVPFPTRLAVLDDRLHDADAGVVALALDALDALFNLHGHRTVGPSVVAGRIPPPEWRPSSGKALRDSLDRAVAVLSKLADDSDPARRDRAREIAIKHVRRLLALGYLEELGAILDPDRSPHDVRVRATTAVESCLHLDARRGTGRLRSLEYAAAVRAWLDWLKPTDIHGRLLATVGVNPWHHTIRGNDEAWRGEIGALAAYLSDHRTVLEGELAWLFSGDALSAPVLGEELGKRDAGGALLETLVQGSLRHRSAGMTRGYIAGLLGAWPAHADAVNRVVDGVERVAPELAYHLFTAAPRMTHAARRTLASIDTGALPVAHLQGFLFVADPDVFSPADLRESLRRLVAAAERDDIEAGRVAAQFVASRLDAADAGMIRDDAEMGELAWRVLEVATRDGDETAYHWAEILGKLYAMDPDRAARLAVGAIMAEGVLRSEAALAVLEDMAGTYPDIVLMHLGQAILDPSKNWHFYLEDYTSLIRALPMHKVEEWVRAVGVDGARALARQLPQPYLSDTGDVVVPPLTAFVLETFGDDARVLEEFLAGSHGYAGFMDEIIERFERKEQVAAKALYHPVPIMREWARRELAFVRAWLAKQREEQEEDNIR